MCESPAVSKEHVPPKCIFPEQKDANGRDFRRSLITVPSCDVHNSAKSKDDEYLMMVLTSYFTNNQAAQDQIRSKIARAWAKNPGTATAVVKNLRSVQALGQEHHAFEVDTTRFDQSLAWAANGLYFHVFRTPIKPGFKIISYPLVKLEGEEAAGVNKGRANILSLADQIFSGQPTVGENPEIFWFQVSPVTEGRSIIRMCFFEAFPVVGMSSATLEA